MVRLILVLIGLFAFLFYKSYSLKSPVTARRQVFQPPEPVPKKSTTAIPTTPQSAAAAPNVKKEIPVERSQFDSLADVYREEDARPTQEMAVPVEKLTQFERDEFDKVQKLKKEIEESAQRSQKTKDTK